MSNKKVDKVFTFSNGKTMGLCGYSDKPGKYEGLDLFECGSDSVINEWGEITTCIIKKVGDTLVVKKLYPLATGKNFELILTPFLITDYYYFDNHLNHKVYFRHDLTKYSSEQIDVVLKQYVQSNKKENNEYRLMLAHQLFWAYVSGNNEAGKYLETFDKKYGPYDGHFSGAIAEEWDDIISTYYYYAILKKSD